VAFCAVNALRRNINSHLLWDEPDEWLTTSRTMSSPGCSAPVVFAVIAAFSRVPARGLR